MQRSLQYTLSISLALSLFSGCALQPTVEKRVTIDLSLPVPSLNGSLTDVTSAAFEWKAIGDPNVTGYNVYRSHPAQGGQVTLTRIATLENRLTTHYLDKNLLPNTHYSYRFTSTGKNNSESNGSEMVTIATLPMIAQVSYFQSIGNMPRSAKLIWRPHPNARINGYAIDRSDARGVEWKEINVIEGRLNAEYIDTDLSDGETYYYRVRAITFDKLSTPPSEIVKVVTKRLPPEIKNLTATSDQPKLVNLKWEASPLGDLNHYNIYRSASKEGRYEYYVKLHGTTFSDKTTQDGESFYYQVTAVDNDGLESPLNSTGINGTSLGKPRTPVPYDSKISAKGADLQWTNDDPRIISYSVLKTTKNGFFDHTTTEFNNITETEVHDNAVKAGVSYIYQIIGMDKNGLRSLPTAEIKLQYEAK
ncbi:MAG: fibronectin type III domain-containing protein [Sulfuricurvum sp.]